MRFEQISSLQEQMVNLGYREGEVNAFIYDIIGDKPINTLNDYEYQELTEYLNSYIAFAGKSKKLIANSR